MEKILIPNVLIRIRHVQVVFVTLWKCRINRSTNERLRSTTQPLINKLLLDVAIVTNISTNKKLHLTL